MESDVLELLPDGILLLDEDGRIAYSNQAAIRLLGIKRDITGLKPLEAIPLIELHEMVEDLSEGTAFRTQVVASGSFDLRLRARATPDGAIVVIQDVTEFSQAIRARTDFVANVSHELRTPLTSVMGYAETLLSDWDRFPDDLGDLVDAVWRNARRLRDLFEDLLQLHRIESRKRELPLRLQKLAPILSRVLGPARDTARQRHQELVIDCPTDIHGWVNEEALGAIVANLAQNACTYTPEGGTIRIAVREDSEGVRIQVEDDGIGIDPIHHRRIFERFYRVDHGRSRRGGGTGLGLAIVKHLANASNATIDVQSQLGEGSVFTVRLPPEGRYG